MNNGVVLSVLELQAELQSKSSSKLDSYHLDDDLYVLRGKIVGVFGHSGVGKTELLRNIIDSIPDHTHGHTKYVSQELPFFSELSLRSNFRYLSDGGNISDLFKMAPHLKRSIQGRESWSIETLSGGERRQLALVAVAKARPDLLIIDETLISLDPWRLDWALMFIRQEVREGRIGSVLLVSHDEDVLSDCDVTYEITVNSGKRCIRSAHKPISKKELISGEEPEVISQHNLGQNKLWSLLRFVVGAILATGLLLLILVSPRIWNADLTAVIPNLSDVIGAFRGEIPYIIQHGWWSLQNSIIALFGALVVSALFWLAASIATNVRRIFSATWITFQTIPVVLFSPLVVIVWGYNGRLLEIIIALFIAVFPLGLIGVRALATTPEDIYRAHRARSVLKKYYVGIKYNFGDIARGFVACAPLSTVGVIVAEYLIKEKGLGWLVHIGLTNHITFEFAYAYVLACALLACAVVLIAIITTLTLLPHDLTAD